MRVTDADSTTTGGAQLRSAESQLDREAFLQLLITKLKTQNPLEPQEEGDFIAQMAQFSALEQMQQTARGLAKLQGLSLLGRRVTLNNGGESVQGTVTAVSWDEDDGLHIDIGDESVAWKGVTEVRVLS